MRRLRLKKEEWSAAGLAYAKGTSLQKELLKSQTAELTQQMTSSPSTIMNHMTSSASTIMNHVTAAISPIRDMLLPAGGGETTAMAKKRLRLQMSALQCIEQQEKQAKQRRTS